MMALGIVAAAAWAATPPRTAAPAPATARPDDEVVATVGPERITRDEYDRRWTLAQREYHDRIGTDIPPEYRPTAQRQVLELLLRQRLLTLEARRLGITGTPAEAEAMLRQDPRFQTAGRFDAARYDAFRTQQPNAYQRMLDDVLGTIGPRKLQAQLEREARPTDAEVRASDTRRLTTALVEYLPLYRSGFDGNYPEPTEPEVLAEYRKRASEHMLPEQLRFSVIHVDQPPLADTLAYRVDQREAWTRRMRQRADSLIGALRSGASIERLAVPFGGVESMTLSRGGPIPAWWRGRQQDLDQLFGLATGRVASQPIDAATGPVVVRLEQRLPPRPAPLQDVVTPIRERLRRDARVFRDDRAVEAMYQAEGSRLRGPANRIRYGVADTSTFALRQPSLDEMKAFYDAHLTDYSSLGDGDEGGGEVRTLSFGEVRFDVYRRMVNESRSEAMMAAIRAVAESWKAGKRDPAAERLLSRVSDVGVVPHGGQVDTSLAGLAISDSLAHRGQEPGVYVFVFRRGITVVDVGPVIPDYDPTLAQVRPMLERRIGEARQHEVEEGGRRYYAEHPEAFRQPRVFYMGRLIIPLPFILDVPVSREEVERRYHQRIRDYSSSEKVRIRHVLITPRDASPAADAEALARADSLTKLVRAGADIGELALRFSDDPASREVGGDVGRFERGQMLPEFERVAFSMQPGDVAGPVRTEVGYHVMKCVEHIAAEATPLEYCYNNVAWEIAQARIDRTAHLRADSVRRFIKTPAQAREFARRAGFTVFNDMHPVGERVASDLIPFFRELEKLGPGQLVEGVQFYRGLGYAIAWVDSVVSDRIPPYGEVSTRAEDIWRRQANDRAMQAKRAEFDSLARAGWGIDSLATLFGGFTTATLQGLDKGLKDLGSPAITDSLLFGTVHSPPGLEVGQATDWIEFGGGLARLRLAARTPPAEYELAARAADTRRGLIEGRLRVRYAEIARRFPVRILDVTLAKTQLPAVPAP